MLGNRVWAIPLPFMSGFISMNRICESKIAINATGQVLFVLVTQPAVPEQ